MKKNILFFLLLVLISGCKTNPPVLYEEVVEYGNIFVSSNIDSAKIILDNTFTGKYTPDTITATVGEHIVKLEKADYSPQTFTVMVQKDSVASINLFLTMVNTPKIVLLEDFANVSCAPCVISNSIVEQLVHQTYGAAKIVVVKFPTNFPSPNDPFFLANKNDANQRMNYYKVIIAPSIFVDGIEKTTATDSISIKQKIDLRLSQIPVFGLSVNKMFAGSNINIDVALSPFDASVATDDLILHVVVIESKIEFPTPPGSNGETIFYNVMRRMLPDNGGTSLAGIDLSKVNNFNFQTTLNASWQSSEINIAAFIQNAVTKEILQAASTIK
ncbi:MAG: Omp28-related outer membrane protein [Ignavibacteriaceae bacterium]|nr:Omp28-related outer membrane protein [Ignavibacteriaceae bacterium]